MHCGAPFLSRTLAAMQRRSSCCLLEEAPDSSGCIQPSLLSSLYRVFLFCFFLLFLKLLSKFFLQGNFYSLFASSVLKCFVKKKDMFTPLFKLLLMSCRLTVDSLWKSSLLEHVLLEAVDDFLLTAHLHLSSFLHMHLQLFRLEFFQIIKGGIVKHFCVAPLIFAFLSFCFCFFPLILRCWWRIVVLGPERT